MSRSNVPFSYFCNSMKNFAFLMSFLRMVQNLVLKIYLAKYCQNIDIMKIARMARQERNVSHVDPFDGF